jgi:hypothetical protein
MAARLCAASLVLFFVFIVAQARADVGKTPGARPRDDSELHRHVSSASIQTAGSHGRLNSKHEKLRGSPASDCDQSGKSDQMAKPQAGNSQDTSAASTASGSETKPGQATSVPSPPQAAGISLIETQTENTGASSAKALGIEVTLGGISYIDATLISKVRQLPLLES